MNNNENINKLTDEQVDAILEKINEVTKDQEIPTREYTEEERTGFFKEEKVMVNPTNGEHTLLEDKEDDKERNYNTCCYNNQCNNKKVVYRQKLS